MLADLPIGGFDAVFDAIKRNYSRSQLDSICGRACDAQPTTHLEINSNELNHYDGSQLRPKTNVTKSSALNVTTTNATVR